MKTINFLKMGLIALALATISIGCNQKTTEKTEASAPVVPSETPEYYNLRPEVEKAYGYSHAVKSAMILKSPVP